MANCNENFLEFLEKLDLSDTQEKKLRQSRDALRNKITNYFKSEKIKIPINRQQGSFALKTQNQPAETNSDFDLDDGIYLQHYDDSEEPSTLSSFKLIEDSVEGHTDSPLNQKNTCVRVQYKSQEEIPAHHIDLAIYRENAKNSIFYAHRIKGWIESDQKGFLDWFIMKIKNNGEQLRRIVRFLKAWADYQENSQGKLPSGFHLTVLAVRNFCPMEDSDDYSFAQTCQAIQRDFNESYIKELTEKIKRPVKPFEDIFENFETDEIIKFNDAFQELSDIADKSINSNTLHESCKGWNSLFGDRFDIPPPDNGEGSKDWPKGPAIIGTSGKAG